MKLSDHFTLQEMTRSQTAERNGWNNQPDAKALKNLRYTAAKMEKVRALLQSPIYVTSGYRSLPVNRAVGSSDRSHHRFGYAVDFHAPGFGSPQAVVRRIKDSGLQYDQLIYEGSWVHISFAPAMRRQTLIAHFGSSRTFYTNFV